MRTLFLEQFISFSSTQGKWTTWLLPLFFFPVFMHAQENPFNRIPNELGLSQNLITSITQDSKGFLWVGGFFTFLVFDPVQNKLIKYYRHSVSPPPGIPEATILSLFEDRSAAIWVGTNGYGLYQYNPLSQRFADQQDFTLWKGKSIRSIYQTSDGTIWVSTTDLNLYQYDRENNTMTPVKLDASPWKHREAELGVVYKMMEDRSRNLWLGSSEGLFWFDLNSGEIADWAFYPNSIFGMSGEERGGIFDLKEDQNGEIWLITTSRFGRFNAESKQFFGHSYMDIELGDGSATNQPRFYQQNENTFWLCTIDGLFKFDKRSTSFDAYKNDPTDISSLSQNVIRSIHPDPKNPNRYLWIGTEGGGLNRFDLKNGTFEHFKEKQGLPDNVIYGILSDQEGFLWLSTNKGISKFDPETLVFKNYDAKDGLQDDEFNAGAFFKNNNGELFFGGIGGFNAFFPERIKSNDNLPSLVITGFERFNKPISFKDNDAPLVKPISEADEIILSHKDKVFSLKFAALDFTNPSKNQYAYKLENFDQEWRQIGSNRMVTFTNLNPGEYIFRVRGSNNDGLWNNEGSAIKVIIKPPFWRKWWAFLFYLLLLAGIIYIVDRYQSRRLILKEQLKHEKKEALRLKEVDELKSQLYTNITHEFRTPLSVIMGMADNITGNEQQKKIIQRNSNNLLRLINQMLDLSKLETGNLKLDLIQTDIMSFLQYLTESFYSAAAAQSIRLTFYAETDELIMDFDETKVQQIVYNLLSNAIKFTPESGKIVLHAKEKKKKNRSLLQLKIKDTGIGIDEKDLPHIFDRFYQGDASSTRNEGGTGIGLALTKELINLMGGSISVKSEISKGSEFTILLPVSHNAKKVEHFEKIISETQTPDFAEPEVIEKISVELLDAPTLLIIEDNQDVTTYIHSLLQHEYIIQTAKNGQEGIEVALEKIPDIIISDVMMPRKNGFEVCQTLKNDERTSHIPIILLTAKATQEDKVKGLECGADAYLMKPFDKEELFVRLKKLIDLRKQLQQKFHNPENTQIKDNPKDLMEDGFLIKLRNAIENKIDDSDFAIVHLCRVVHLSHTQVYRKLKALTGKTPSQFIRSVRMHKALDLLKNTKMNISEIAYQVGFNDPNYFTRTFQQEFGESPSGVRRQ